MLACAGARACCVRAGLKKKKKLIKKEVPPGGGHPLHLGWLNPAITSSVGDSTVQFLVVGTCVRARPLLTVQCHTVCIQSCLCVSVMLGAGMCRCSGLLRSRRAQKKKN